MNEQLKTKAIEELTEFFEGVKKSRSAMEKVSALAEANEISIQRYNLISSLGFIVNDPKKIDLMLGLCALNSIHIQKEISPQGFVVYVVKV